MGTVLLSDSRLRHRARSDHRFEASTLEEGRKASERLVRLAQMAAKWPSAQVFAVVLLFRIVNALLCRTFFQPDEFYQSLEVAHRLVFGFGYQTWEWRAQDGHGGIRSPIHAFIFVPAYSLVRALGLEQTQALVILPKVTQATIMAVADVATFATAENLLGPGHGHAALACSLTSFFNAFAGIRTFSNSTEMTLTACALALWPWRADTILERWDGLAGALSLAALTVAIRPSSLPFWLLLGLHLLKRAHGSAKADVIAWTAVVGVSASLLCAGVDTSFYAEPTFTPLNFFRKNVLEGVATFYGSNSWHFYATQGLPFVLWSTFPTTLLGLLSPPQPHETPQTTEALSACRSVLFWTIAGLSCVSHKEFRFLQPLTPLLHSFAARALVNTWAAQDRAGAEATRLSGLLRVRMTGLVFRTALALGPALYLIRYHCLGQVEVANYIRRQPLGSLDSVGFLMPCHSTPWQSHMHRPDLDSPQALWMLTCEPPSGKDAEQYKDESDIFFEDPAAFLQERFDAASASHRAWPARLVLFDNLLSSEAVSRLLGERGYLEDHRIWNSRWHDDPRRTGDVIVLARAKVLAPSPPVEADLREGLQAG